MINFIYKIYLPQTSKMKIMTCIKFMLFLTTIWSYSFASAQDGRIIDQVKINASADSILKPTNRLYDTLTKILANVDVYQITYMSDGLKIKGFMDIPKKPGKYPCIIYNRGGQREYSKLTSQHYMGRDRSNGKLGILCGRVSV